MHIRACGAGLFLFAAHFLFVLFADRPPLLRVYCRAERAVKLGQGLHVAPLAASSVRTKPFPLA